MPCPCAHPTAVALPCPARALPSRIASTAGAHTRCQAACSAHCPLPASTTLVASPPTQGYQYSWCVDPLDGTKEFLKRNGQFTVNIALLEGSRPVLGIVAVPVDVSPCCCCRAAAAAAAQLLLLLHCCCCGGGGCARPLLLPPAPLLTLALLHLLLL